MLKHLFSISPNGHDRMYCCRAHRPTNHHEMDAVFDPFLKHIGIMEHAYAEVQTYTELTNHVSLGEEDQRNVLLNQIGFLLTMECEKTPILDIR